MDPAAELKELLLRPPGWSVAAAESLTTGHVQAAIGAVSGASNYFRGGLTAYTLEHKVRQLGVDRAAAEASDCVSPVVAEQMARGACALFGADVAVATTGYAEPDPARAVRVPHAWWAVWHDLRNGRTAVRSGLIEVPGATRTQVQATVAAAALVQLVNYLRAARAG
ncbi:MAG TPA: CinA family protein [Opitutaceae bacterium]|nr:CinA family protein [Opitutaceae bacterium]